MKLQRFFIGLFTAFLLLAQQAGHAHAISHLGKDSAPKEQLGHDRLCGKCVNFEKLSSAASFGIADLVALSPDFARPRLDVTAFGPRALVAFHSRGPPALSVVR